MSTQEIGIHGFAPSTFVRTVRMVCEEKEIDYKLLPLEFKQDSHRDLHPFLRMPVMTYRKVKLFETLAIATYLDLTNGGPSLQPAGELDRAEMLQWISVSNHYVYHELVLAALNDENALLEYNAEYSAIFGALNNALEDRRFLAGNSINLADLFLIPQIDFMRGRVGGDRVIEDYPALGSWYGHMSARPSFQKTAA